MSEITSTLVIDATPETLWSALSTVDYVHNWHPKVDSSPAATDQQEGVGAQRYCHFYDGTQVKEEVVRSDELRRVDIAIIESSMPLRDAVASFELTPRAAGGTEVRVTMRYGMKLGPIGWLMNLLMIRPMMGKMLGQVLAGLEAHVTKGVYVGKDGTERPLLAAVGA